MQYELTHDSIARQVYDKAEGAARMRRKIEREIKEAYQAYLERGTRVPKEDLDYFEPYLTSVNISPEEAQFLKDARRKIRRARNRVIAFLLTTGVILAGLATWAIIQKKNAVAASERFVVSDLISKSLNAYFTNEPNLAYNFATYARILAPDNTEVEATEALNAVLDQRDAPIFKPLYAALAVHGGSINSLSFSSNGELALTASDDHTAKLSSVGEVVDPGTEAAIAGAGQLDRTIVDFKGHTDRVMYAAFLELETHVVTVSKDNSVRLWDLNGNETRRADLPRAMLNIYPSADQPVFLVTHENGQFTLVRATIDSIYQITRDQPLGGDVRGAHFTRDLGTIYIWTDEDTHAFYLDLRERRCMMCYRGFFEEIDADSLMFSKDGRYFFAMGPLTRWRSGAIEGHFTFISTADGQSRQYLAGPHQGPINDVDVSSDGQLILTASDDSLVRIWDFGPRNQLGFSDARLIAKLSGHRAAVIKARFSDDASQVFTTSLDGTTRVWSLKRDAATLAGLTADLYAILSDPRPEQQITAAQFTPPDQHWIATTHAHGEVRLWDASAVRMLERLEATGDQPDYDRIDHLLRRWGVQYYDIDLGVRAMQEQLEQYYMTDLGLLNVREQRQFRNDIRGEAVE
ncbi:MAG: hypothetical protein R3301_06085 [Saprospiraceae bacterium]|nr:hypothetical protein [Saprospiraceae bacterium]